MSVTHGTVGAAQITVEARIIRADGTVEELGTVAYWHRNPFKRLAWRIGQARQRLASQTRRFLGLPLKGTTP